MPPRLNHRKSRAGCQQCKARRVKARQCDEQKPACSACVRHARRCEYPSVSTTSSSSTARGSPSIPTLQQRQVGRGSSTPTAPMLCSNCRRALAPEETTVALQGWPDLSVESAQKRTLELQLMHNFMNSTCNSIAPSTYDLWRSIAPQLAFREQHLLDAMHAMSAKELSLQDEYGAQFASLAHDYFNRALEGQRRAVQNLDSTNAEALMLSSSLICILALHISGLGSSGDESVGIDVIFWMRLASQIRTIFWACQRRLMGTHTWKTMFRNPPDMSNEEELFSPANRAPLEHLLTFQQDDEAMAPDDHLAYAETLSFVGLIYHSIEVDGEHPLITARRITAMPSRAPPRFIELVVERRPRALVISAYFFASLKAFREDIWWLRNIAEHQTDIILEMLPPLWKPQVDHAVNIARSPQGTPPGIWVTAPESELGTFEPSGL